NAEVFEFLDTEAESEVGAAIISLDQALALAFNHSREYQARRERLYLEALSLTFDRYRYTPAFAAGGDAFYQWDAQDQFVTDMQSLTGMTRISTTETVDASTTLGSRVLLKSGGVVALTLTNNFLRFLTGDIRETAGSALLATFDQPLLRDFGREVETEALIQAERDLLYELRDFTRFRKTFAVRVASGYYSVLLDRETAMNNYLGLQAVNLSLEREQAFQEEGLRTLLQVGRLEQSALQRDLRWTASITRYKSSLDNFKVLIGLTQDDSIVLDDSEMDIVAEIGMVNPDLELGEALELALTTRLDLYTELDRVQDSARRVNVAANALAPALDLSIRVNVPESGNLGELDFENAVYTAGLALDLPLDTKLERNDYRRALIGYDVAIRDYLSAVDDVKLDVANTWRRMTEAQKNYEINQVAVEINERRVEEAELRAELGLGDIQDTVDAQNDLTTARTDLVASVVDFNIAKLEFWRDLGLLYINEDGQWEEGVDEP
ncbi:MAG: TolC family protein, partial [Pseudohongiellaceae bacterium]